VIARRAGPLRLGDLPADDLPALVSLGVIVRRKIQVVFAIFLRSCRWASSCAGRSP